MEKIIEVRQKPIIAYDLIKKKSDEVEMRIKSLSINTLQASEDNLSLIKSTRAELNNEFKILEEQRKMVKDIVLKDYNTFEEQYKNLISSKFKNADVTLKGLVDTVTDEILQLKINGIREYFNEVNKFDYVKFDNLGLKIIKSVSDKKIKDEIDIYLNNIKESLETIETLPNKERVLAKFQMSKNLNDAISQTNLEIQREEQIRIQREIREKKELEQKEKESEDKRIRAEEIQRQSKIQSVEAEHEKADIQTEKPQIFSSSFKVYGTKDQLTILKQFMNENNIKYEGISR